MARWLTVTLLITPIFVLGGTVVVVADALEGFDEFGGGGGRSVPSSRLEAWLNDAFQAAFDLALKVANLPLSTELAESIAGLVLVLAFNGIAWSCVTVSLWSGGQSLLRRVNR